MNKDTLNKALDLDQAIDMANRIKNAFCLPYPFILDEDGCKLNSSALDKETLNRWKELNKNFFEERLKELENEFEKL